MGDGFFVHDQLAMKQRIRTLSIIDNFTREACLWKSIHPCRSLRVIRDLEPIAEQRALPHVIRTDNGPEFASRRFLSWSMENGFGQQRSSPANRFGIHHRMLHRGFAQQKREQIGIKQPNAWGFAHWSPRYRVTSLAFRVIRRDRKNHLPRRRYLRSYELNFTEMRFFTEQSMKIITDNMNDYSQWNPHS
jgi:Integrase core domain